MEKKKKINELPAKVISFDGNNPEDQRLYKLLDKTRYNQSKFIKQLLRDFYRDFSITEETPYEDVNFIVKAYIDKDSAYNQYQVLNRIVNRGNTVPLPQTSATMSPNIENPSSQSQSEKEPVSYDVVDDEDNQYIGTMASGFDSLLDD